MKARDGAPIRAVKIPIGNNDGGKITFDNKFAFTRTIAPQIIDKINSPFADNLCILKI